jgi:uroporphyrinogen decarboxylase
MSEAAAVSFDVPTDVKEPCFDNLLKVLRKEKPDRPTLFEFFLNDDLHERLTGRPLEDGSMLGRLQWRMEAFRNAGYDYVTNIGSGFGFRARERAHASTVSLNDGAVISDEKSFDEYKWENPEDYDTSHLERIAPDLPDGMKLVVQGPCGVLENVIRLVGFENLCFMLMDAPDLAKLVFDNVGLRLLRYYEIVSAHDTVGACISNDDWGFKSQPMLSPDQLREYVFPWHTKIVAAIHAAGKPAILHSCGNAASIMGDIIDVMKFDGKHSYEDSIQPVEEAYEQYHERVAILGGIDVDFVCRSSAADVYARSKAMLERASDRGAYALGTGNSVPAYVPQENYLAMIAAVR